MREQINAARETASRAIKAARELGLKITETQTAGQPVGELEEQFNRALKDSTDKINDLRRLEAMDSLDASARALTTPNGSTVAHRGIETQGRTVAELRRRVKVGREEFRAAHLETFESFLRNGVEAAIRQADHQRDEFALTPVERHALTNIQGDLGGFLAPDDFQVQVLRDLAGFAVIRGMARVMTTGRGAMTFPTIQSATTNANIYGTGYTGAWKAEGYVTGGTAPTVQNQPTFGQSRIPVHSWQPNAIEVTSELLEDNDADLEGILAEVIAETLGLDEDAAFINGSGVGMPQGLMNAGLTTVNTGSSGAVTYGGLIDLYTNLPAQYRGQASWLMGSLTFGAVLKLVDSQSRPLFPVNAPLDQLWTRPIAFSEFMPTLAPAAKPIIFGNFKYYGIADRRELRMQRLVERFAPNVGLLPTRRTGGQVLRTAAFRVQLAS